ncbi:MAG: hypothetical protein ACUVRA_01035 [Candidatus Bathyarchaeaceae archaeon]
MSFEEYVGNPLWPLLVETVHAMVMYPHHKAYTRDVILHEQPDVTARDLSAKLGIPLGEALVILYELRKQKTEEPKEVEGEKTSET